MDNKTEFRDAWAQSKQATVPQVLQAAAPVIQEISRGGLALDRLMGRDGGGELARPRGQAAVQHCNRFVQDVQ